jgi:hypothetical protein
LLPEYIQHRKEEQGGEQVRELPGREMSGEGQRMRGYKLEVVILAQEFTHMETPEEEAGAGNTFASERMDGMRSGFDTTMGTS